MSNCLNLALAAAKGRLSQQEVMKVFEDEQKIREGLIKAGRTDNLDQRVANRVVRVAMEKKIEAARLRRQVIMNARARATLVPQVQGFMDGGLTPVNALRALHEGSQKDIQLGRTSSDAQGKAYQKMWMGSFLSTLEKERPGVDHLLGNKAFDTDVTREMWELRKDGKPGSTGNDDAKYVARLLADHLETARQTLNEKGAAIGKLDGYAGPQVHDDMAMLSAGREKWVSDIMPLLDMDRTFNGEETPESARQILRDTWDTIVTGRHLHEDTLLPGSFIPPSNLAKGMAQHRVLHFSSPDAAITYRDQYGRGSTIQGSLGTLNHYGKFAGVMDKWGPSPKAMMLEMASRIQNDLREKVSKMPAGTPEEIKAVGILQKQIETLNVGSEDMGRLEATVDDMIGNLGRPVSTKLANIGSSIRATQQMAKLGGAVITSIPSDTLTAASAAMFRGHGFWKGMFATLGEMANRTEGRQVSHLIGEGFEGITGHIHAQGYAMDNLPGVAASLSEKFFKWSGLTGWTDAIRAASARVIAAHLGSNVHLGFDELHPSLQHVLSLNNIGPDKWELFRKAGQTLNNGVHYLTPDLARRIPMADMEARLKPQFDQAESTMLKPDKNGVVTPEQQQAFAGYKDRIMQQEYRDLEIDLHRYFADETGYSVIDTDAHTRRIAQGGGFGGQTYRKGTMAGEAMRFIMQFKSFPIAFSNRVLGRAIYNAPNGRAAQVAHLGAIMAGLTVAGYMAMTMKDLARGVWPPRDPFRTDNWGKGFGLSIPLPSTMVAAMLQGGALGIYGDFLFGNQSRMGQSYLETAAGPVIGDVGQLLNLYQAARDGNPNAGTALDVAINNTPFVNMFYTRSALDFLFLNSLRETMRPGYLARQEQRLQQQKGQSYLLPRTLSEALH